MRNAMNIYKRKDGRFEGRISLGHDEKGNLKYKYLYSRNLSDLKKKCCLHMLRLKNIHPNAAIKP